LIRRGPGGLKRQNPFAPDRIDAKISPALADLIARVPQFASLARFYGRNLLQQAGSEA
jgi:hypothetical protein